MLTELMNNTDLSPRDFPIFSDIPSYADRQKWDNIHPRMQQMYLAAAQQYLHYPYPALPAMRYFDYFSNGDRDGFENLYFERRKVVWTLTIAECMEGKGRFLPDLINGIWAITEETNWVMPAHLGFYEHDKTYEKIYDPADNLDLFSAETGTMLAWVYYLLKDEFDKITKIISHRMEFELKRRILTPFLTRDLWWMGFGKQEPNNWNPWIMSSVLPVIMIIEKDADKQKALLSKSAAVLDKFIEAYPKDGGCDEGPMYWNVSGASFMDCLGELYDYSQGQIDLYGTDFVKNMVSYIAKVYIGDCYYAAFADADAKVGINGTMLYRFGKLTSLDSVASLGISVFNPAAYIDRGTFYRQLLNILSYGEMTSLEPNHKSVQSCYLSAIQVMTARESQGTDGFFLAAKGGNNDENHNHNDVGSFIVYHNAKPVLIDTGLETYTAKTFSDKRYELWYTQSGYHNLPTINGMDQKNGRQYAARHTACLCENGVSSLTMEIGGAYDEAAGIERYQRTVSYHTCENEIRIRDSFSFAHGTGEIIENFICYHDAGMDEEGKILLTGTGDEPIYLHYDSSLLAFEKEALRLTNDRMIGNWDKDILYRVRLRLKNKAQTGTIHVTIRSGS